MAEELLNVKQAAQWLDVCENTVYKLLATGALKGSWYANQWHILSGEVERLRKEGQKEEKEA